MEMKCLGAHLIIECCGFIDCCLLACGVRVANASCYNNTFRLGLD